MMQWYLGRRLWRGFIVGAAAVLFSLCTSAAEPGVPNSQSLDVGGYDYDITWTVRRRSRPGAEYLSQPK